jgi:hypothetical protein
VAAAAFEHTWRWTVIVLAAVGLAVAFVLLGGG